MGALRRALLFARSVRHTRPSQLAARVRLVFKRKVLERLEVFLPIATRAIAGPAPALDPASPLPILPPRTHLAKRSGRSWQVRVVEERRDLSRPIDWQPGEWQRRKHLHLLNLHAMEFLEAVDDEFLVDVVEDWIEHNPPYGRGYWLYRWNGFALSIRCVVWMQQIALRRDRLPPRFVATALRSLAAQLRFLEHNLEVDLRGNHLVKNIKALLWAGRFFCGGEATRWRETATRLLLRELAEQILPDGMHYERSPAYHAQVFADLLECASVVTGAAGHAELRASLEQMAQALADMTHPDGKVSLFNDGGLTMTYAPVDLLETYARLSGVVVRPRAVVALASAGYFGIRDGKNLVLADCGAIAPDFLPAHGHGDILSFEWTLKGRRLVVDAGVYEYSPGAWRDFVRSTAAHNTVTVGGADQCEFWSSFRVGRRARVRRHRFETVDGGIVLEGSHDGFAHLRGQPRHSRRIEARPERIVVTDVVEGGAGQQVCARLLLHPDARVEQRAGSALLLIDDLRIELASQSPMEICESWWCPDFGERQKATQIVLHYGPAPCTGGFRLLVAARDAAQPVESPAVPAHAQG